MRTTSHTSTALLLVFASIASSADAQPLDQSALAQRILSGTVEERYRAVAVAERLTSAQTGATLRSALIQALVEQSDLHARGYWAERRGQAGPPADPELRFALIRTVGKFEDPAAIPALVSALGTGVAVNRALMRFGAGQVLPSIVRVVTSDESTPYAVIGGLVMLRWILEGDGPPLNAGALQQVRQATEQRLSGEQNFVVLWNAIDLAVTIQDTALLQMVAAIAADPNEVVARGITDPELIADTQRRAAARLDGEPALPSCC